MSIINEYNEYSLIISGNEYKHKQDAPRSVVAGTMKMDNFKYKYSTKEERVCFFENIDFLSLQFAWQLPLRIQTSRLRPLF